MVFRYFFILFFTLFVNLFALSSKEQNKIVDELSVIVSSYLYNLEYENIPLSVEALAVRNSNIKAIEIKEDFENKTVYSYFLENEKPLCNQPIPEYIKENYFNITKKSNYNKMSVGEVTVYFTEIVDLKLNTKEEEYLSKNSFNIYATNWEPFTIYDKKTNSYNGLAVEFWNIVSQNIKIDFKINNIDTYVQMLKNIKNDQYGILLSTSYTKERAEYAVFSKPYVSYPIAIATGSKESFLVDLNELNNKRVAVGKNYSAHKLLKKYYPKIQFVPVNNTYEAVELLSNKEVFAAADILPVLKHNLEKLNSTDIKISGTSEFKFEVRFMVNKSQKELIPILNKAIDAIDANERTRINSKWTNKQIVVEKFNYTLLYYFLAIGLVIVGFLLYRQYILRKLNIKLEKQKNDFEEFFEKSPDGISILQEHKFVMCNSKLVDILKYDSKKEILNLHPSQLSPEFQPDGRYSHEKAEEMISLAIQNGSNQFEWIHTRADGEEFWAEITLTLMILNNQKVIHVIWRDISEKKRNEEIIMEQSKMAALGEMIANISHQWRQPLSVISTAASGMLIEKQLGSLSDERFEKNCEFINDNAQYLSRTIDDFKNFTKGERKKTKFALADNINSFLNLIEGTIKSNNLNIIKAIDDNIMINGYPNELIQCLINIFNNSKDALKQIDGKKYIFISTQKKDDKVIISLKDNGGGIAEDILSHVFEPYFTTKHQSQGTGLGLHMTYNLIVKGMNGAITIKNIKYNYEGIEYRGVECKIILPLS